METSVHQILNRGPPSIVHAWGGVLSTLDESSCEGWADVAILTFVRAAGALLAPSRLHWSQRSLIWEGALFVGARHHT